MSDPAKRRREIGYVCHRGHYQFVGEDDYGACGSKKVATIYAEALYPDDDMHSVDEYESEIDEAHSGLISMLDGLAGVTR
jgi:hypothetical protein